MYEIMGNGNIYSIFVVNTNTQFISNLTEKKNDVTFQNRVKIKESKNYDHLRDKFSNQKSMKKFIEKKLKIKKRKSKLKSSPIWEQTLFVEDYQ